MSVFLLFLIIYSSFTAIDALFNAIYILLNVSGDVLSIVLRLFLAAASASRFLRASTSSRGILNFYYSSLTISCSSLTENSFSKVAE